MVTRSSKPMGRRSRFMMDPTRWVRISHTLARLLLMPDLFPRVMCRQQEIQFQGADSLGIALRYVDIRFQALKQHQSWRRCMPSRSGLDTSERTETNDGLGRSRLRHRSGPLRQGRWALSTCTASRRVRIGTPLPAHQPHCGILQRCLLTDST